MLRRSNAPRVLKNTESPNIEREPRRQSSGLINRIFFVIHFARHFDAAGSQKFFHINFVAIWRKLV